MEWVSDMHRHDTTDLSRRPDVSRSVGGDFNISTYPRSESILTIWIFSSNCSSNSLTLPAFFDQIQIEGGLGDSGTRGLGDSQDPIYPRLSRNESTSFSFLWTGDFNFNRRKCHYFLSCPSFFLGKLVLFLSNFLKIDTDLQKNVDIHPNQFTDPIFKITHRIYHFSLKFFFLNFIK